MEKELKNLLQDESEDAILARIQEESLRYYNEVELPRRAAEKLQHKEVTDQVQPQPHCSKNNDTRIYNEVEAPQRVAEVFQQNGISDCEKVKNDQLHCSKTDGISQSTPGKDVFYKGCSQGADGFHLAAGETYVYPTNYPIRKYQKSIIHSALFHNTLVSLPTGLGKTFIAAVVMYNYYRWFPQGKIVFMAPTRPLVAQQIRACHDIMAIPIKDTVEMTGTMNPADRLKQWKSKRVFFLTPQVMANDLRSGVCPAIQFKCVVIDEAHRATKEYSYCHVIKELEKAGAMFRILALSATPGSNIKAVVEVVQNLRISTLELRGEDSPDVTPYTHAKEIEPVSLSLSKNILDFREQFLLIFERYARSLREARLITCNVQNITKFQLLKASERIRSKPPNGMAKARVGVLMADFTVCMTLAHGLELLQTYGLRAFHQYFTGCEDEENRKAAFTRLRQDVEFHQLMENLHKAVSSPMDQFWSHPKHEHLVKILKEHFSFNENQKEDSKVIIFCQYRVVVSEVYELLQRIHPSIKPIMFIGQGVGKDRTGLPQKKQIEVMKNFREGKSNVLIATCVAEEGLDIGSVDLLILMEVQRSPVRLVQRLGRTGRHRQGRCVVLLTQGKEVQKFDEAMATKKSFINMIQNSKLLTANLFKDEPTMVPSHLMPKMQLVHINVPERVTPGKVKKQSDIRQALMAKLNETEEAVESPFLLPEQEALVKEELNTLKVNFDCLSFTESKYLYNRFNDAKMDSEELFNVEFSHQSEFTDWNRVLQQTYLVSHSSDSEILCHLLDKAESMQLGEHKDLNSQMDYSSIVTNKKRVSKAKTKRAVENPIKKKKTEKEEKHGMDIRECMALAADKARLTQDKCRGKDDSVIISEPLIEQSVVISPHETLVQDKEHGDSVGCALCNYPLGGIAKELQKFQTSIQNFSFNFNLSRMEIFVKSLTKEVITKLNVSETLKQDMDFTVEDINRNIMALKASNNVKETSGLFDVNDIFETEFQTPPKTLLPKSNLINRSLNKINPLSRTPNKILVKSPLSQQRQDYFDLEDIFGGDDDEDIQHWGKCSRTSTPIRKITPVFDLEKNQLDKGVFQECAQKPSKFETIKQVSCASQHMSVNQTVSPSVSLFKVPQMKLDPQILNNFYDTSKSSKVQLSPQSPVLSGQLVPPKISASSVSVQGCRNSFFKSPESPILTGQLTLSSKISSARREERKPLYCNSPESPILSSQILPNKNSSNKAGRKVLFSEDHINKQNGDVTKSTWCKPLCNNMNETQTNDICTEIEGDDMLSASQLFDDEDSNEGSTKNNLDQSSMYTISQMVAKVTALAKKPIVHELTVHQCTKDAQAPQKVDNKFGSSDEDSLFENINLDDFSLRNGNADTNKDVFDTEKIISNSMSNSGNISNDCGAVSRINENAKENSYAETTSYKNSQLNRSNSIINNQQNSSPTHFEEVNKVCEESSITSRWLSCMKSPFQPHTIKTSTPHVHINDTTNFDSDSDSHDDVFQSPLQKKNRPPVNFEKNTRKEKKRQLFVEMEADVTGPRQSSDEENTSGLDDLDESFINDMTEQPCTSVDQTVLDMQARYLQSVKSPVRKPGGFKIPKVSDSVLAQDVFSQFVEDEEDSYLNDSFCCDATEIPVDEEPSVLEMAEYILNQDKKSRKIKKTKRKRTKFNSSSDDNEIDQELKAKWLLSSESSDEDQVVKNCKTRKRKQCFNSESSHSDQSLETKKAFKRKRIQLLTSDSDSDRTL